MSVTEKIQQLLWNRRFVRIPEEICPRNIEYVMIKDMTVEDRNLHTFIRKRELEIARKQGVPTEAELMVESRKAGIWTERDDYILNKIDEHIKELNDSLEKQKFLARKKLLKLDIEEAMRQKESVICKKNDLFINSADYYASEVAAAFLIRRVVCDVNQKPILAEDSQFLLFKREYPGFIIFLTNEVLSEGVLPIEDIREVARNPEWRLTWTLQRENLPGIFNKNVGDLNLSQKLLIYWSRVYDSAYESTEPPSHDVINDDEKFDEWLSNRDLSSRDERKMSDHQESMQILDGEYIDYCNCGAKAKNKGKGLGERILHTAQCPYGVFRRYSAQEREKIANQIYSRNNDRVRTLIDKEQEVIMDKGVIEEQKLRDKKSRHVLGMKTEIKHEKN